MSAGFAKIFGSILDSSIWHEPGETRLVWITMLAMADGNGVVEASLLGLAHRARVSVDACRAALKTLSEPDEFDRSGIQEGRRIETLQGAWRIVNHRRYREKQGPGAKRQAEYVERKRNAANPGPSLGDGMTPEAEAEAEAEDPDLLSLDDRATVSLDPLAIGTEPGIKVPPAKPEPRANGRDVVLEQATEAMIRAFNNGFRRSLSPRYWQQSVRKVMARGFTEAEIRGVVWWATDEWATDPDMAKKLSPKTLLKLQSSQGYRTFPEYLSCASERWRETHDGADPPWEKP